MVLARWLVRPGEFYQAVITRRNLVMFRSHRFQDITRRRAAWRTRLTNLAVTFSIFGLLPLCAQTQVIPQVADGAGWSTTVVIANKTASTQSASLAFHQAIGGGATSTWAPPFLESV